MQGSTQQALDCLRADNIDIEFKCKVQNVCNAVNEG